MTAPDTVPARADSRRLLLTGLAAAAVAGGLQAVAGAPLAEAALSRSDPVLHLLRRATFGPTRELYDEVRKTGTAGWLDAQLAPSTVSDTEMDNFAKRFPRLSWRHWEVRENVGYGWEVMEDYLRLHTARHIWSRRQLLEVVADFWTDHLVVPAPDGDVQAFLHTWHRDVIRKHALGRYADMLKAGIRHPALLSVLDNASSTRQSPNENHGRELLELHTVGVGNYTEADVRQAALALTGLSFDGESLLYEFKPQRRYVGALKLLGWSNANSRAEDGEKVALSLMDHLARHPRTAERIARKLAIRFVSDAPSATLVADLASTYLANDTNIAPVLRRLFTSAEFTASIGLKTRRPYEDVIATFRILGHRPDAEGSTSMGDVRWTTRQMGHVPGGWSAPDGYPDQATAWQSASSTLHRWNMHLHAASGWSFKTMGQPDLAAWLTPTPTTYDALVQRVADKLLLTGFTTSQRTAICTFLERKPTDPVKPGDAAITWRYGQLVAVLLDTLSHAIR